MLHNIRMKDASLRHTYSVSTFKKHVTLEQIDKLYLTNTDEGQPRQYVVGYP